MPKILKKGLLLRINKVTFYEKVYLFEGNTYGKYFKKSFAKIKVDLGVLF